MSDNEHLDWVMSDASLHAQDAKEAASYAIHHLEQNKEAEAREALSRLFRAVDRLRADLDQLDYTHRQIAAEEELRRNPQPHTLPLPFAAEGGAA